MKKNNYNYKKNTPKFSKKNENIIPNIKTAPRISNQLLQDHLNKILKLFENKNFNEILNVSETLIKQFPDNFNILAIVGASHANVDDFKKAIEFYKKALEINPTVPDVYNNMGIALKNIGDMELAIKNFDKAIELRNFFPDAYNNLGTVYQDLDDFENAKVNYEIAIKQNPNHGNAFSNLGLLMASFEKVDEAIEYNLKAIKFDINNNAYWLNLALTLRDNYPKEYTEEMANLYLSLFERDLALDPINLVNSSLNMLKNHSIFKIKIINLNIDDPELELNICKGLNKLKLLLKIMKTNLICDIEVEKLFTKLRKSMLLNKNYFANQDDLNEFKIALASQCFLNEYTYRETPEERFIIEKLESEINSEETNETSLDANTILLLSTYRPLNKYKYFVSKPHNHQLHEVYKEQIDNVLNDQLISKNIQNLTQIKNKVSIKVREQYEENPYPRWVNCGSTLPCNSLLSLKKMLNLKINNDSLNLYDNLDILVAGCGTGKEVITTALRFPNSKILAFDLSKSSLSYGIRKSKELAIKNINFMTGDILELESINQTFDIIESSGVLHHLDKPFDGISILNNLLNKNGLMKIALYSEYARSNVNIAREVIKKAGLTDTKEDILKFRNYVIDINDEYLNPLMMWSDFFSISELRDLVFHKNEHQYNLLEVKKIISKLKLDFIGFEFMKLNSFNNFTKIYGLDKLHSLKEWHEYETNNQDFFSGMYQFWLEKK
jgi:Flp pilus assembly protein TadD/SAM-dependent methyltransferase